MSQHKYKYQQPFTLESGAVLPEVEIAYHTYGTLSPQRDNIVWVCHALTANSDVADWWPGTVESGRFLDPERYFVICANILGSCYGTTGSLSISAATGEPYYGAFPRITVRDVVNAHRLLASHLRIKQVKALVGASIGGFQVAEWLVIDPNFAQKAVIIASAPKAEPWVVAFNESQRMAIEADTSYGNPSPHCGAKGLAAARSIALLSYRSRDAYNSTQSESDNDKFDNFRACSYQRYQGKKLVDRFDAYTYYLFTQLVDSHNLARGRGSMEQALSVIRSEVMLIAISSDVIYPVESHLDFERYIPRVSLHTIDSNFGHDGFLVENEKLNTLILSLFNR